MWKGVSSMSNRMYKSALIAGAMAGSLLWASTAGAVTVTIGLQQAGVNSGNITDVATGVDQIVAFNSTYGNFIVNISGQGSPPNIPANVGSSTANTLTQNTIIGAGATLNVFVGIQGIASPTGLLNFLSTFTENNILPTGWHVTESTFLDPANGKYTGGQLATHDFTGIDTNLQNTLAATGAGPYSVTLKYTVLATDPGTALSTI